MTAARPAGEPGLPVLDACCPSGCSCATAEPQPAHDPSWQRAAGAARRLSWFSLAWMTAEGALGLAAGVGSGSVSLAAWALGSVIEGLASVIVIWRFTGSRLASEGAGRRARKAVAVSFFLLAPCVAAAAARDLVSGHRATASALGLAVTAASAVLAGLAATAAWGWSWLDPAIALLLAGWAVREGITAGHGDDCC